MTNTEKIKIVTNLAKLVFFLTNSTNWCRFAYQRNNGFCLLGAISFLFKGDDITKMKNYLLNELPIFIESKKLIINTGEYPLNLATFNDNVPHSIVWLFLKKTYEKLLLEIDNNL